MGRHMTSADTIPLWGRLATCGRLSIGLPAAPLAPKEAPHRLQPASQLAVAYTLDLLLGDPEWFPHPVRWFGALTTVGERCLRPLARGPVSEMLAGAVLTGFVASVGWALGRPKNPAWQTLLAWT